MNFLLISALFSKIKKNVDFGTVLSVIIGTALVISILINVMQGYRFRNLKLKYNNIGRNIEAMRAEAEEKLEIESKLKVDIERIKKIRDNVNDIEELKKRYIKIWNGLDDLE